MERSARENDKNELVVEQFVSNLTPEEKMLIVLKRQLYGGKWSPMIGDLKNRLAGKPYVFKLETRIKDDIKRVHSLMEFEQKHGIDLADFVSLDM